jgi:predicted acyl esterase
MMKDWNELISQPKYKMKVEKDVRIKMRDGVHLAADIYHPDAEGKFPALLSMSCYGKDIQKLPVPDYPTDPFLGNGGIEAGNSEYFVMRGYVHIIADSRGTGLSEGAYRVFTNKEQEDGYDLVEWIAGQPWCNGNVGMLGISYFGMIQYFVAAQNPPHLKAIFPADAATDHYRHIDYHGGILNLAFAFQWWEHVLAHTVSPPDLSADELKRMVEDLKKKEDIRSFPTAYILLMYPEKNPRAFDLLVHPYDGPFHWERSSYTKFEKITIPCHLLSRWTAMNVHLPGAFSAYNGIKTPGKNKKLMITIPESGVGFNRPWHENHDLILRWYDHWLKGIDTGMMKEPPIRIFVQGRNEWRYENEWPLARTKWTKFYLRENASLSESPPLSPHSPHSNEEPDHYTNKPGLKPGQLIPGVEYLTVPLREDIEITGPIAIYFYASLSDQDTDWMVVINDINLDGSEKVVSKGWLKASHRELDENKSKPYQPFHPHTRSVPIELGKIYEYAIDIKETSYVFKAGHRIHLKIKSQDAPWEGKGYDYAIHRHFTRSKETLHTIYHNSEYRSYLLLPIIS